MRIPTILAVLATLALTGCRSDKTSSVEFPCNCGTPEAAIEGCLHPVCVEGETNPDNPDCACGTLSFGKE